MLKTLWARKLHMLVTFLMGIGLVFGVLPLLGDQYVAHAVVSIKEFEQSNQSAIISESEVLKSRMLAARVVKKADLMNDAEFNFKSPKSGASVNVPIEIQPQSTFKNLSVNGTEIPLLSPETVDKNAAIALSHFSENLSVEPQPESSVIRVSFLSETPEKAAFIVNTLVDEYLAHHTEVKQNAQLKLMERHNDKVAEIKLKITQAEQKADKFRSENNLENSEDTASLEAKKSTLQRELVQAKEKLDKTKAKLRKAQSALDTEIIQELKRKQSKLKTEISELSKRYGEKHPVMIDKRAELASLMAEISKKSDSDIKNRRRELNIAKARISKIEIEIENVTARADEKTAALKRLHELEIETKAAHMALKTFLENHQKTRGGDDLQVQVPKILSYASVPHQPFLPNKAMLQTLGIIASFASAILAALIAARMDTRIKSTQDLEAFTGLACGGFIPSAPDLSKDSLTKYVHTNPSSQLTESVRSLYAQLEQGQKKPAVIAFISANKGEGKTTIAALLAAVLAKSDRKVILIDANLHEPGVGGAIKQSPDATLVEFLTGHKDLEEIITKDTHTDMDIIFAQGVPNSASDLVRSKNMKNMIAALRRKYDHVIIDTPSCADALDAKVLARLADQNVLIVDLKNAKKEPIEKAMKYFQDIPSSSMALAVNRVSASV